MSLFMYPFDLLADYTCMSSKMGTYSCLFCLVYNGLLYRSSATDGYGGCKKVEHTLTAMPLEFSTVDSSDGPKLSVRLYRPEEGVPVEDLVLVLVHQYSILGGCQALLKGMALELASRGYICITFDLRGVGRSTGRPSLTGSSEVHDVVSVCRWAATTIPANRILLVGSSAGAPIAGSAVDQVEQVVGYVGLGYPFGLLASVLFGRHNKSVLQSEKPKLFVMGTRDGFTSVKQLEAKLKSAAGRVEKHLIDGIGHFAMEGPDYDPVMADLIAGFAKSL